VLNEPLCVKYLVYQSVYFTHVNSSVACLMLLFVVFDC